MEIITELKTNTTNIKLTNNLKIQKDKVVSVILCVLCKIQPFYNINKCIIFGCKCSPKFNYEDKIKKLYCEKHATEDMINLVSNICKKKGCKIRANFNKEGETKGLYCGKHKLDGMEDVVSKRCFHNGCKSVNPKFNKEGETKGFYCSKHKLNGMEDVVSKRCFHDGCKSLNPKFNKEGETKGLYCGKHKLDGMEDVLHKRCFHDGCKSLNPIFNKEGETKGLYCGKHKLDGMEDIVSKRCFHDSCKSLNPNFNKEGETIGLYCGKHKLDGMEDVVSKRCKTHLCYTIVRNKYRGYCLGCFIQIFPNEPVSRNYKNKERNVVDNIKRMFPDVDWVWDRKISGGCSQRRPDLFLDMGTHIIIIEIDENKHDDYDCSCENKRIMQISQDVGHTPIVFIRFNPDKYTDSNGKKITSCWGLDGNNIMAIKKCKVKEWNERMNTLNNQIQYWVDNSTDKTVETIQLFY